MIKLKDILLEVLNNFSVEADVFVDPDVFISEIINEIRALEKVTIVSIITPDEYVQKSGADIYVRLRIKFVTRYEAKEALQSFLDDALSNSPGPEEDNVRIPGVKSMKFRDGTLKRID